MGRAQAEAGAGLALNGTLFVPVLPIRYANTASVPWTAAQMQTQLFGANSTGSVRDYYEEVSYGAFTVTGTVFDWVQAQSNDIAYEGAENGLNGACAPLILEAISQNDDVVDFGAFDNDGPDGTPNSLDDDGVVDVLLVVHPERGGECGSTNVWSHHGFLSWHFPIPIQTDDPSTGGGRIVVDRYLIAAGQDCLGGINGIGLFCHELGHAIGIKDLYDTDDEVAGDSDGIGVWGLMGAGNWNTTTSPAHMTAWTKERLGWLSYLDLVQDVPTLCLPPVETNPTALRLWTDGEAGEEYFVVENRQQLGFDMNLMNEGLVIYHVDDEVYDELQGDNAVNADERAKALDVECADAFLAAHVVDADDLDVIEAVANNGDATDVWCQGGGGTDFGPGTVPDTRSYSSTATGLRVHNVGPCSGGIGAPPDWVCASYVVGVANPVDVCIADCDDGSCNEIATCEAYWETPNIWVDNDGDGDHDPPAGSIDNQVFVRVRNLGPDVAVATGAALWLAEGAMGLEWPTDAVDLVGTAAFPVIGAGEEQVRSITFTYPDLFDLVGHYCMGVVLGQAWDATISESPPLSNNVAQINSQVLVARAADAGPGRSAGGPCGGPFSRSTRLYLYDGYNPAGKPVTAVIRVGSPPDFDDAVYPDSWSLSFSPGTGPFALTPGMRDSVTVTMSAPSALHGESGHVPLTLWNVTEGKAIGGTVLDFMIDCWDPFAPEQLAAQWRSVPGDVLPEDNVLVEWTPVTVDLGGNPESVQYYEVWRARDAGTPSLVEKVAIDADPAASGFQWHDRLPRADCPTIWTYTVRAVDLGGFAGPFSLPFVLDCEAAVTSAPDVAAGPPALRLAAHPLPVADGTTLRFELPLRGDVDLAVYDARGGRVRTLVSGPRGAGEHAVAWDARDDAGRRLASGVYFALLESEGTRRTLKLVVVR
jgi:M6 family metalloprotease-like protein